MQADLSASSDHQDSWQPHGPCPFRCEELWYKPDAKRCPFSTPGAPRKYVE